MIENNKKLRTRLVEWVNESEDQNFYCKRSLVSQAIISLLKKEPDINKALNNLLIVASCHDDKYDLILNPPSFTISEEHAKKWINEEIE